MRDGGAHNVDEVHLVIPCWCVLKQDPESLLSSCCSVADPDLWHVRGEQEKTGLHCREPYIVSVSQPCVKIAQRDALVGARCLRYNWDCEMLSVWPRIIKAYQIPKHSTPVGNTQRHKSNSTSSALVILNRYTTSALLCAPYWLQRLKSQSSRLKRASTDILWCSPINPQRLRHQVGKKIYFSKMLNNFWRTNPVCTLKPL